MVSLYRFHIRGGFMKSLSKVCFTVMGCFVKRPSIEWFYLMRLFHKITSIFCETTSIGVLCENLTPSIGSAFTLGMAVQNHILTGGFTLWSFTLVVV